MVHTSPAYGLVEIDASVFLQHIAADGGLIADLRGCDPGASQRFVLADLHQLGQRTDPHRAVCFKAYAAHIGQPFQTDKLLMLFNPLVDPGNDVGAAGYGIGKGAFLKGLPQFIPIRYTFHMEGHQPTSDPYSFFAASLTASRI